MWDLFFSMLDKFVLRLVALLLAASILLIFSDAMLRVLFSYSIFWLQEVILYFVVWSTMLGAAVAVRNDEHIKVDLLIGALKPKLQMTLKLATSLVGLFFSVVFTYSGINVVFEAYRSGIGSITTLETPLWIPYLILPAAGIIFVLGFCNLIGATIAQLREVTNH